MPFPDGVSRHSGACHRSHRPPLFVILNHGSGYQNTATCVVNVSKQGKELYSTVLATNWVARRTVRSYTQNRRDCRVSEERPLGRIQQRLVFHGYFRFLAIR
jgi:hypothetical protein